MARPRKVAADAAGAASIRSLLGDAVADAATAERVRGIVGAAFGAVTEVPVVCPECSREFSAPVPDFKKQLETLIALGQAEARADEGGATSIVIERPAR